MTALPRVHFSTVSAAAVALAAATLVVVGFAVGRLAPAAAPPLGPAFAEGTTRAADGALAARVAAVEERARHLESAIARAEDLSRRAMEAGIGRAAPADRFQIAMLHLQNVASSPRPWQREFQLVLELTGPGQLHPPLAAVLGSHAARGVPTLPELRERFALLVPGLLAHAPGEAGLVQRVLGGGRWAMAGVGLAGPAAAGATEATLASISDRLRRGDLAGAVHDATLLDQSLQPSIAAWLADGRARLAVDQAIQEVLLQSLTREARRP